MEFSVSFLKEDRFYPQAAEYFMFWTSLMTVELITEVQEVETSFLHQREYHKAQVIVEEEQQGKEIVLKVKKDDVKTVLASFLCWKKGLSKILANVFSFKNFIQNVLI